MTAQQAYDKSTQAFEAQMLRNKTQVYGLIDRATALGQFKIMYDRQLMESTKQWLIDYGYEVSQKETGRNELTWIISWENAR